jgi:hypothetical protein
MKPAYLELNTMGRVLTEATIENLVDLWDAKRGLLPADKVPLEHLDLVVDPKSR